MKRFRAYLCIMMCFCAVLCAVACSKVNDGTPSYSEDGLSDAMLRTTVLYYVTDDGYIVPVMKKIPWEEGIGTAALSYLVSTVTNSKTASENGLKTVIPDGSSFDLRIDDKKNATVDIKNMPKLTDQKTEKILLETVVNTLTEFPTIDTVTVLFDGKNVSRMHNGTAVSACMSPFLLNVENEEVSVSAAQSSNYVTVYFPNNTGAMQVPITRNATVSTFESAMSEMVSGTDAVGLKNCIPKGTALLGASIVNGVATVDFSNEFSEVMGDSGGTVEALYNSIYLTAAQFDTIAQLVICVEGQEVVLANNVISAPMYANMFR